MTLLFINIILISLLFTTIMTPKVLGCGLVGFSGEYKANVDKIKMLFIYNQARGKHSCGYYNHNVAITPEARIIKRSGNVIEKIVESDALTTSKLFIGHTRHATMGNTYAVQNAHPFLNGDWVCAHNGVIRNLPLLLEKYDFNEKDIDVDSKVWSAYMAKYGNFKILNEYEGAAALIWTRTDHTDKKPVMFVYRNAERPLFRGYVKIAGKVGMYISSLENSLEAIGCTDIKEFEEETLHTIVEGEIKGVSKISRAPLRKEEKKTEAIDVVEFPRGRGTTIYNGSNEKGQRWKEICYNDKTIEITDLNFTKERQVTKETLSYCPDRKIHLLTRYYNDGGFLEVAVSKKQESQNDDDENTMSIDVVMDYITQIYQRIDEFKNNLDINVQADAVKETDVSDLDEILVNMETFMGNMVEISEIED